MQKVHPKYFESTSAASLLNEEIPPIKQIKLQVSSSRQESSELNSDDNMDNDFSELNPDDYMTDDYVVSEKNFPSIGNKSKYRIHCFTKQNRKSYLYRNVLNC